MQLLHALSPTLLSLLQCEHRLAFLGDADGGGGMQLCRPPSSLDVCGSTVSDMEKETEGNTEESGESLEEGASLE